MFKDGDELKLFSVLSQQRKKDDRTTYLVAQCEMLNYFENAWDVKKNFTRTYGEDYLTLTSSTTAFSDNYSSIFREDECWRGQNLLERFDRQPLKILNNGERLVSCII